MLVEEELQKVLHDLISNARAQIFLSGADISISVSENYSKMTLITPVYFGGNYIPASVRAGITRRPPFERHRNIKTFLTIDENRFAIFLHCEGTTESLNSVKFGSLLDDFCYLSEAWRTYLHDKDQNDRVYVYAR